MGERKRKAGVLDLVRQDGHKHGCGWAPIRSRGRACSGYGERVGPYKSSPESLGGDREVALAAVLGFGRALQY
eukprot:4127322-Amphidinium_carterae.1